MKLLVLLSAFIFSTFTFQSSANSQMLYERTVTDLNSNSAGMTYFSLKDSAVVTGSDTTTNKWDLAFKGTAIWINGGSIRFGNGGAVIKANTTFSAEVLAPDTGWRVDETSGLAIPTGSNNGWYSYDFTTHIISPIAGRIFYIKTGDGKYSKIQIIAWYQGGTPNPSLSNSGYYTFKYVYQPDGSRNLNATSAVNNITSEVPEGFTLSQNYPNPFNPETNIRFSIPKASNVSLKVYDAMGKEVQTLVNGNLSTGTYEADFNASGLSSGIYFYKLVTDKFTEAKKMILSK